MLHYTSQTALAEVKKEMEATSNGNGNEFRQRFPPHLVTFVREERDKKQKEIEDLKAKKVSCYYKKDKIITMFVD